MDPKSPFLAHNLQKIIENSELENHQFWLRKGDLG